MTRPLHRMIGKSPIIPGCVCCLELKLLRIMAYYGYKMAPFARYMPCMICLESLAKSLLTVAKGAHDDGFRAISLPEARLLSQKGRFRLSPGKQEQQRQHSQ